MLDFDLLWKTTTLLEDSWRNISGKYADFTCSSSGGEVEMSRSINRPEQSSWISNHNKTYNTSLGPLEDELVAGYAVILKKLKMWKASDIQMEDRQPSDTFQSEKLSWVSDSGELKSEALQWTG